MFDVVFLALCVVYLSGVYFSFTRFISIEKKSKGKITGLDLVFFGLLSLLSWLNFVLESLANTPIWEKERKR